MVRKRKIAIVAVGALAAAGIVLGGAALASAATGSPSGGASNSAQGPYHTPVTGDELSKVTAAVKAKDAAVTVTSVTKDADGSYDVFGTKDGNQIKYDVSADLSTFTQDAGGPGGDHGGRGPGGNHTAVTGDELSKVTAAVKAKDSTLTVTSVRKDPDGSYDVLGTQDGNQVTYDMSSDLSTLTQDIHQ